GLALEQEHFAHAKLAQVPADACADHSRAGDDHIRVHSCSYFRKEGKRAAAASAARMQSAPPDQTEKRTPASFATTPASTSPSCGPPMKNIMLTEVIRPRSSSG